VDTSARLGVFFLSLLQRQKLIDSIVGLGYGKVVEGKTRAEVYVYLPKTDRKGGMSDITEKLVKDGAVYLSSQKYSSIGHIEFEGEPYKDLRVLMKPDASKGLTTDEQESLAAYYAACKFSKPTTDYGLSDFSNLINVQSSFTAEELIGKASAGWLKSSALIADKLYELYRGNTFQFCQRSNSTFVDNISDRAQDLLKEANFKVGLDKWNPADIWLVHSTLTGTDFSKFKSIEQLNAFLLKQFNAKKIIGVSLKQVASKVTVETYNKELGKSKDIKFNNTSLGKKGFTNSIDGFIYYNTTSSLVVRSFKPLAPISGEITGTYAAGGKIGNGPLENAIQQFKPRFSMTNKDTMLREYKKDNIKFLRNLYQRAKPLDSRLSTVSEGDFISQIVDKGAKTEGYLVSKVQVMDVIEAVESMTAKQRSEFIQYVISYASSALSVSSVFVKLYQP